MEEKHQHNTRAVALASVLLRFLIFVLLGLFVQTGFAQSKCEKNAGDILECDLSISLVEKHINRGGMASEQAWYATSEQRVLLQHQLEQFAEHWCDVTLGKSSIREISILRGYKKSSADVALYRNTGRSYSYVGAFSGLYPSIVLYYAGFYNPQTIDRNLGRVLVHEFAHASLKVYDEYRELGAYSSPYCLNPLATDFPRETIMNDHTRYTRFSHPDDYADTPPPQTAQYRCYGKSAWEVLMQPERCDSNLSLEINSWFPRHDYFAAESSCSPRAPSLNTLKNPRSNNKVNTCIRNTQENLKINFLSGAENLTVLFDSGIEQANKVAMAEAVKRSLDNFAANATTPVIVMPHQPSVEEVERLLDLQKRKLALGDFNGDRIPTPEDIEKYMEEQRKMLDEMIKNAPDERNSINDVLDSYKKYLEDKYNMEQSIPDDDNRIVIMSDTTTTPSISLLEFLKRYNIVVDTIGIGDTINPGLSTLSLETGGKSFTLPSADKWQSEITGMKYGEFVNAIVAQKFSTNMDARGGYAHIRDGDRVPIKVQVPPGSQSMSFYLHWDSTNSRLDKIDFEKPDGTKLDSPDLRMYTADSFSWSTIAGPGEDFYVETGRWTIYITGSGRFDYETRTVNLIDASVHAGTEIMPRAEEKTTIVYPAPFPIKVRVHGHIPLLHAKVAAKLLTPSLKETPISLNLLDNGKAPDSTAGDGIYSGVVKNYAEYGDGIYIIKVTINNPDGNAVFDDGGVATFGTTQSATPLEAPPFRRVLYHQVEVTSTKATLTNTDHSQPRDINADGTLSWGTLSEGGDKNWYRFRANNDGYHYIQTSNLLKHGNVEMETRIDLYEQDPNNGFPLFEKTSAGHRGTNVSHIQHPLNKGKYYLVSVSHVNNGTGVYGLTVKSGNDLLSTQNSGNGLLSTHEINRAINRSNVSGGSGGGGGSGVSGSSGGGGGSIDYFLLMLMLTTLAALYVRTKPISARRRIHTHLIVHSFLAS